MEKNKHTLDPPSLYVFFNCVYEYKMPLKKERIKRTEAIIFHSSQQKVNSERDWKKKNGAGIWYNLISQVFQLSRNIGKLFPGK